MNRKFVVIIVFGVLVAAVAWYTMTPSEVVLPQKPPIEDIDSVVTVDWLADNLGATNLRVVYVGVGSGAKLSYTKGHIPGSIYIDANDVMEAPKTKGMAGIVASKEKFEKVMSENGISNDDVVVVYGKYGGKWDAAWVARMWWTLKYYGHEKVGFLDGGIEAWDSKGEELSGGSSPKATPATYTAVAPDESLRATGDYVLANIDNPNAAILDVRAEEEYTGEKKLGGAERGGHIKGAVLLNWREVMKPDGTFKSKEELRKMYEATGVAPDKEIIIYCQAGVRVAHTLLVLKGLLDYPNVRNYDGSWDEWANAKNPDGTYKYPIIVGKGPP